MRATPARKFVTSEKAAFVSEAFAELRARSSRARQEDVERRLDVHRVISEGGSSATLVQDVGNDVDALDDAQNCVLVLSTALAVGVGDLSLSSVTFH